MEGEKVPPRCRAKHDRKKCVWQSYHDTSEGSYHLSRWMLHERLNLFGPRGNKKPCATLSLPDLPPPVCQPPAFHTLHGTREVPTIPLY
eukprot:scaffold11998_cov174-Amphora_coffeaeformis.AAC.12